MSGTMNRSVVWVFIFFFNVFLQVGSAQNNSCVVTVHANQTAYNITKMPNVSHLERCEYSWANASNYVLANNFHELPELVMRKSINTLVISQCRNRIILSLNCFPLGLYTYNCLCDCSEPATLQKGKEPQTETSNPWIYMIVVIVIILVLVAGVCFLVYRYRDDIFRICSRLGNYTPGKRSSVDEPMFSV